MRFTMRISLYMAEQVTGNLIFLETFKEKFSPFRSPCPDFRFSLLNFLADLDSPIFSSEQVF